MHSWASHNAYRSGSNSVERKSCDCLGRGDIQVVRTHLTNWQAATTWARSFLSRRNFHALTVFTALTCGSGQYMPLRRSPVQPHDGVVLQLLSNAISSFTHRHNASSLPLAPPHLPSGTAVLSTFPEVSTNMPPRRRARGGRNDDTKSPPQQKAKYVSLFGSPKAPAAAPVKRKSTSMDQSILDPVSRRKIPRPAAVPSTPTAPTTPHLTTGRFVSPQTVARAFELELYQHPSAASPMATTPTIQTQSPSRLPRNVDSPMAEAHTSRTQSRLPPSTDARKAPRKGTAPTPVMPDLSYGGKSNPQPEKTERPQRTGDNLPALPFPLKTSQEMVDERLLEAKARGRYILSIEMGIGTADELDVAVAAPEARARARNAATVSAPTPSVQPVPQPQRPRRLEEPQEPKEPMMPKYNYNRTSELEGIKRALGEHDWNEYVSLVEKVEYGKVDRGEFAKQERRIFQTPTFPGLYKVVRQIVAQQLSVRELGE